MDENRTSRRWALILSAIIAARVACAALLFFAFINDQRLWAIGVFLFASFTDALDGYLARRLGVVPSLGPYFDVSADFVLVLAAFSAFVIKGVYPAWTLLLTAGMFVQFVWTSGLQRPLYDPLGKYYGVFLFAAIGMTLAFPQAAVRHVMLAAILGFTALSLASRSLFLARRRKGG